MGQAISEQIFRARFQDDLTGPASAAANRTANLFQGMIASMQGNVQVTGGGGPVATSGPTAVYLPQEQIVQLMGKSVEQTQPEANRGKTASDLAAEERRGGNIIVRTLNSMKDLLNGFVKGFIIGRLFGPALDVLTNVLSPLFVPMQDFLLTLAKALAPLIDFLLPPLQDFFINLSKTAVGFIDKVAPKVLQFFRHLPSLATEFVEKYGPKVMKFFEGLWSSIVGFVTKYGPVVLKFFKGLWDSIVEFVDKHGPVVMKFFKGLWDIVYGFARKVGPLALAFFRGLWDIIAGFVDKYGPVVKQFFIDLWDSILGFVDKYGPVVKQFFIDLWDSMKGFVKEWGPIVLAIFEDLWGSMKELATEWGPRILSFFKDGTWKSLFGKIPKWVKVLSLLWTTLDMVRSLFGGPMGLISGFGKLAYRLAKLLGIIWMKDKAAGVTKWWEGIKDRADEIRAGDVKGEAPSELASGGVVSRTGLAIVHEGEAYIPKQFRSEGLSERTGRDMLYVLRQMVNSMDTGFSRVSNNLGDTEDSLSVGSILEMGR